MATKKKGILSSAGEWWKHLRPFGKRSFWKSERRAAKDYVSDRVFEGKRPISDERLGALKENYRRACKRDEE